MPEKGVGVSLKDFSRRGKAPGKEEHEKGAAGAAWGAEDAEGGDAQEGIRCRIAGMSRLPGGLSTARGRPRTKNGKGRSLSRPA